MKFNSLKDIVTQRKAVAWIYLRSQDGRGRFPACQGYGNSQNNSDCKLESFI